MHADDMRDYLDQGPDVPPTSTANLGPYLPGRFLADLPDWSDLSRSDYTKVIWSSSSAIAKLRTTRSFDLRRNTGKEHNR